MYLSSAFDFLVNDSIKPLKTFFMICHNYRLSAIPEVSKELLISGSSLKRTLQFAPIVEYLRIVAVHPRIPRCVQKVYLNLVRPY